MMLQQSFNKSDFEDPLYDCIRNVPSCTSLFNAFTQNSFKAGPVMQGDQNYPQEIAKPQNSVQKYTAQEVQNNFENYKNHFGCQQGIPYQGQGLTKDTLGNQTLASLDLLENLDSQEGRSQYKVVSPSQQRLSVAGSPNGEEANSQQHRSSSSVFNNDQINSQLPGSNPYSSGNMHYMPGDQERGHSGYYCDGDNTLKTKDRRERRMLSNRESARRSRKRKQEQLQGLMGELEQQNMSKQTMAQNLDKYQRENESLHLENKRLKEEVQTVRADFKSLLDQMLGSHLRRHHSDQVQNQPSVAQQNNISDLSSHDHVTDYQNLNSGSVNINLKA